MFLEVEHLEETDATGHFLEKPGFLVLDLFGGRDERCQHFGSRYQDAVVVTEQNILRVDDDAPAYDWNLGFKRAINFI